MTNRWSFTPRRKPRFMPTNRREPRLKAAAPIVGLVLLLLVLVVAMIAVPVIAFKLYNGEKI